LEACNSLGLMLGLPSFPIVTFLRFLKIISNEDSNGQQCLLITMRPHALIFLLTLCPLSPDRETTPSGAFIERTNISLYHYMLSWGNIMFTRSLPDTFFSGTYDNPRFDWENSEYICLRAECGKDCWYSIMLPMDEDDDYIFYARPLAYDTINNYVAYPGENDTLVTIEHIPTGFRHSLVTWDRCGDKENYACIHSVSFDPVRLEARVTWFACGSESHPEVYSTERTKVISLRPQTAP